MLTLLGGRLHRFQINVHIASLKKTSVIESTHPKTNSLVTHYATMFCWMRKSKLSAVPSIEYSNGSQALIHDAQTFSDNSWNHLYTGTYTPADNDRIPNDIHIHSGRMAGAESMQRLPENSVLLNCKAPKHPPGLTGLYRELRLIVTSMVLDDVPALDMWIMSGLIEKSSIR
jgi:hypothetical protein